MNLAGQQPINLCQCKFLVPFCNTSLLWHSDTDELISLPILVWSSFEEA